MNFENLTNEQENILDEYLKNTIKNCSICNKCNLLHNNFDDIPYCFFAFDCIQNNFQHFHTNEEKNIELKYEQTSTARAFFEKLLDK